LSARRYGTLSGDDVTVVEPEGFVAVTLSA
jgi:hypothetical protein